MGRRFHRQARGLGALAGMREAARRRPAGLGADREEVRWGERRRRRWPSRLGTEDRMSGGSTPSQTQQTQAQTQSQQTNSSAAPPSYIQPYLQQGIQALVGDFNANPTAPGYYPGATVAPQSQATQSAIQALFQRGASGSPVVQAADNSVMSTLNGDYLDLSNNPYFASAVAAAEQPQTKQFMTQVLPGVTAQFEGTGRYGSGQQQAYTGLALDSLNQAQANAAAGMANTAYQNERSNQLNAANLAPTLANQDFANIAAMLQAGQAIDANTQANIDSNVARYNYETTSQPNYVSNYLQRLLLWHVDAGDQPDGEHAGRTLWWKGTLRMTAFNFLSGSADPNSLPALPRQRMAPGLIPGPVQPMPLTSGFRAPPLPPGMGFRAMPPLPPVPDFKVQNGPGILDKLLSRFPLPSIDPNGGIMNLDGSSGWGAPAGGG